MSFGGGGGGGTVEQKPWGFMKGPIKEGIREGQRLYDEFSPEYFPGSTVAPQSPYSQLAPHLVAQRALQGSPLQDAASQGAYDVARGAYMGGPGWDWLAGPGQEFLGNYMQNAMQMNPAMEQMQRTASGEMLGGNPYLDDRFNQMADIVGERFSEYTMPGLQASFSGSGRGPSRYSGEWGAAPGTAMQRQQEAFGRTLNDLATDVYYQDYARERAAQDQAARDWAQTHQNWLSGMGGAAQAGLGFGGQLAGLQGMDVDRMLRGGQLASDYGQMDYQDLAKLGAAGMGLDQYQQQLINDQIARHDFYQTGEGSPWAQLGRYQAALQPGLGFSTQQQSGGGTDPFGALLGGGLALGGAALGSPWFGDFLGVG